MGNKSAHVDFENLLEVHGKTSGLDGNTTLSLILTGIGVTSFTSTCVCDNTSARHKGVGQGGLTVIYMSNHGHGSNVVLQVHDGTKLINSEVHLLKREKKRGDKGR
jgi:hypothetical protein